MDTTSILSNQWKNQFLWLIRDGLSLDDSQRVEREMAIRLDLIESITESRLLGFVIRVIVYTRIRDLQSKRNTEN